MNSQNETRVTIKPTSEYKRYVVLDEQRLLTKSHYMKLAERMELLYMGDLYPIIVGRNGEVNDGQHRFNAARVLGIPFYPMVSTMTIDDAARANANTVRYTPDDVSFVCAKMGMEPYQFIISLKKRFPKASISDMIRLNQSNSSDFSDFKFVAKMPKYVEKLLEVSADFDVFFDSVAHLFRRWGGQRQTNSGYKKVIEFLVAASAYDHARMMKKIEKSPSRLLPVKDRSEALKILNSIYNGNCKTGDYVDLSLLKKDFPFDESVISSSVNLLPTRGLHARYDINVICTSNYNSFNLSPYRRETTKNKIDSLASEIERSDWLQYYPVIVDRNNTIIDGQRRFLAAKSLGKPFWYIKTDNITFPMIVSAGCLTLAWRVSDYAKHFAACGNKHYVEFVKFTEENKLGKHDVISAMSGMHQIESDAAREFKLGNFIFDKMVANEWRDARVAVLDNPTSREARILNKALYRIAATTKFRQWDQLKLMIHDDRFWKDGQFMINEFVSFVSSI